ncbi:multidrug resistance protein [Venturia nashicola]|nr:multidrug resistance protein [Venturia nashicola]
MSDHEKDAEKDSRPATLFDETDIDHKSKAEEDVEIPGRMVGGKYLQELGELDSTSKEKNGQVTKVDIDLPLTLTTRKYHKGEEILLLEYADGDKENPFNWSLARKRVITGLLCSMTLFIGLATTAYSSGIDSMCADFGVPVIQGQLGLFTFNFACALAPLFLAPFTEFVGRKVVYGGAFVCFTLCFIGLALGQNIATIIVMRTLLGIAGCVGTILVGGTFSDLFIPEERAKPMALFSYIAILGTVAAPIYAGFINHAIGWRWIEGIQGMANIPLCVLVLLFLGETRGGKTLQTRARMLRESTGDARYTSEMDLESKGIKGLLHDSSVKAVNMLVTEPVVFAFGLWIAFTWFVVFLFLSAIPITFAEKRGWGEGVAGLPYIALVIGVTLGYVTNSFVQMQKWDRINADPNQKVVPEHRLYGAMIGSVFLPVGLFIYSFTQYGYLPWIAPTIALVPISFGIFFVFESTYSYTSDCYGLNSGSAIAGQGLMRNTLGAVAPLFASPFFHNLGSQWAGLLLSILATLLTFIPFVFFKYGHLLRARSKLARVYE